MMDRALSAARICATGSSATRDRASITRHLASAPNFSPVEEIPPMPMAQPFPAFCLLFRNPSRATMLRDARFDEAEPLGHSIKQHIAPEECLPGNPHRPKF